MMNLYEYFDYVADTQGWEASEEANEELIALVQAEEEAWVDDEELDLTTAWAEAHNVDLTAGRDVLGHFLTYFQSWYWDNFED